jgi:hypothetical protein
MEPRDAHHGFSDVASLEDPGLDLQAAREVELALETFPLCRGQLPQICRP